MNEEIMIRLGVAAQAMYSGLNRAGSFAKAWATSLVEDLRGKFGRMLTAGVALESLNKIREKILEIKRVSNETGADTNFVQGLMQTAEQAGLSLENMTMPMAKFNKMLGQAKMGSASAIKILTDMHVITDKNSASSLNFTKAIHNLAVRFDELNDKQKQAFLLSEAFGKGYAAMQPIFERGVGGVDSMSKGNFFTKITPEAIDQFTSVWAAVKKEGSVAMSSIANVLAVKTKYSLVGLRDKIITAAAMASAGNNPFSSKNWKELDETNKRAEEGAAFEKGLQAEAEKEGISVQEEKSKILVEQNSLLQKQRDITAEINDRGKASIAEMAAEARRLTGVPKPRVYGVTQRMREALRITTLEDQATVAFEKGDDRTFNAKNSEAARLRAASPWATAKDQNPMARTESQLADVNMKLAPVQQMAELINGQHK